MATTKNVKRKKAVSTIIVVVGGALLTTVDEVVGGIEVEDEFAGWLFVTLDKEFHEEMGEVHRATAISALFHTAKSRSAGEWGGLFSGSLK